MTTASLLVLQAIQARAEGRGDQARALYERALVIDPDSHEAMANLREIYVGERKYAAALALARRLVQIAPHDGVQWDRLAAVYMGMDRFDEAEKAIEKALELAPDNPVHWHQAALHSHRVNDSKAAIWFAEKAAELDPYGIALKHDHAHMLLANGSDLATALEMYEVRWETLRHLAPWDLHLPEWQGEPLAGKRILLHSEQGLGDAIMLARFARNLVALGAAEVGLCLPSELTKLFYVQKWPGVRVVDIELIDREDWDCHSPMYSVLRWLKLTWNDIDGTPYLNVVPKIITPELPAGRRVGVCWASGRWNVDTGLRRQIPLAYILEELGAINGVRLISLQKSVDAREIIDLGASALVTDPMPACDDFAATAAIVDQLDAVITVDTAVLHLAAAIGKPTFMLCQFTRCWRWWNLPSGRPWYDTVVSVQQETPHDWRGPVKLARRWVEDGWHPGR